MPIHLIFGFRIFLQNCSPLRASDARAWGDIMKKLLVGALCCASLSLNQAPAFAGARTYLSVSGADANTCTSDTQPCKTFGSAITKAGADGEVVCLDSGFFGVINITFPIAIRCAQHIAQTGVNFNTINLSADGIVILDGIDIDLREFVTGAALAFTGVGTLILRNSSIANGENGLRFAPTGNAKLSIANTNFESHVNTGVLIEPQAAGTFQVDMDGVSSTGNLVGVSAFAQSGKTVNLEIRNSRLQLNENHGLYSLGTGTGASNVLVDNSSVSNNGRGIHSTGAKSVVKVGHSALSRNFIGFSPASGGSILSYGDNKVDSVSASGGPTGSASTQ